MIASTSTGTTPDNYFKLIADGKIVRLAFFDSREPAAVTAAYINATRGREVAPGDMHRVAVYQQGPLVPDHLPEIGTWYCRKCNKDAQRCKCRDCAKCGKPKGKCDCKRPSSAPCTTT